MHIATDLAYGLDAVLWARSLDFAPDPWQAQVLRSSAGRVFLNCSRQSGKSTVAALLGLHAALYRPGALVLLLSPSLRQSGELFRKVASYYQHLASPIPPEAESALRLELEGGSRIVSLPGREQTIRGFSGVNLLVIDEAARVADDLYYSVRPMLAVSAGRLVTLSTPFGKRGWWWKEWDQGGDGWERVKIPAVECPRISPEFLAEERAHLGDWWYEQEYLCNFLDAQTAAFTYDMVQSALAEEVQPWKL